MMYEFFLAQYEEDQKNDALKRQERVVDMGIMYKVVIVSALYGTIMDEFESLDMAQEYVRTFMDNLSTKSATIYRL
jgi:hypothetical protein